MAWIRVVAVAFICAHICCSGTDEYLRQMSCFYQALTKYANKEATNFSYSCNDLCRTNTVDADKGNNKGSVALSVKYLNCSIDIKENNLNIDKEITIDCNLLEEENNHNDSTCSGISSPALSTSSQTTPTSVPNNTDMSVSTSLTDDTSISVQPSKDSTSTETTKHSSTTTATTTATTTTTTTTTTEKTTTNQQHNSTPCPSNITQGELFTEKAPSPGGVVGAVLGGAVLGAVITAIVFILFFDKLPILRQKLKLGGHTNLVYQLGDIHLENRQPSSGQRTEDYNEITEPTHNLNPFLQRFEHTNTNTKDDVYNHLHESDKAEARDNYDHAELATSMENGYGMVTIGSENDENYCKVDPTSTMASNEKDNAYFTLKPQDD